MDSISRTLRITSVAMLAVSASACISDSSRWQQADLSDPVCKSIGLSALDYQEPQVVHVTIPAGVSLTCHRIIQYGWQITRVDPILSPGQRARYGTSTIQVAFDALADGSIGEVTVMSPASSNPYDRFVVGAVKLWRVAPTTDATRQQMAKYAPVHFTVSYHFY